MALSGKIPTVLTTAGQQGSLDLPGKQHRDIPSVRGKRRLDGILPSSLRAVTQTHLLQP